MFFRASESILLHGFQSFYYELLRQKEKALSSSLNMELSKDPEVDDVSAPARMSASPQIEELIVSIQKKLIDAINKSINPDNFRAGVSVDRGTINQARYIMCALADEVFINLRWAGAKYWRYSLIEKQLFNSEISGEKIFTMIDNAIANASFDNELVFLYLMIINLGFCGKYRIEGDAEDLEWYKERLYAILHKKPARLFYPGRSKMIEECYEYTYMEDSKSKIPDVKFWSFCITSVIIIYIAVSYVIWFAMTDDIKVLLEQIFDQVRRGPLV